MALRENKTRTALNISNLVIFKILPLLLFGFLYLSVSSAVYADENTQKTSYVKMPRPFLFNLAGPVNQRTVQIKVQLMVRSEESRALIEKHIPLIEDTITSTFSAAEVKKLNTQVGKEDLRQKTLLNIQNTLRPLAGKKIIHKILFTGFVMQ